MVSTQIRLNDDTYEKLKAIAAKELRSMNAQMEYFIVKGIQRYELMEKQEQDFLEGLDGE